MIINTAKDEGERELLYMIVEVEIVQPVRKLGCMVFKT